MDSAEDGRPGDGRAGQRQLRVPRPRGPAAIEHARDDDDALALLRLAAAAPGRPFQVPAPDPGDDPRRHPLDGLRVAVVGDDDGGAAPEFASAAALSRNLAPHADGVVTLPATRPGGLRGALRRAAAERAAGPLDLVVAVSPAAAPAAHRVARRSGARVLVIVRDLAGAGGIGARGLTRRQRAALVDADRVAAVGETARTELRAARVPDPRIALLPWADHPARFAAVIAETLDAP